MAAPHNLLKLERSKNVSGFKSTDLVSRLSTGLNRQICKFEPCIATIGVD